MFQIKQHCCVQATFPVTIILLLSLVSRADSITVELRTPTVYPCEPLIFDIILRLDEPLVESDDPRQQTENALRLRRRYDGDLSANGEVLAAVGIFGAPSYPEFNDARTELRGTYWGFIRRENPSTHEKEFHGEAGEYSLVVRDRHNPHVEEAAPVTVAVLEPTGAHEAARRVFEKPGLPYVARMIGNGRMDDETVAAMRQVANDFPDTAYGNYATASLALWDLKEAERLGLKKGADEWKPIVERTQKACDEFPEWHPLRVRLTPLLAGAQFGAGEFDKSRKTIAELRAKYPHSGELRRQTEGLLKAIGKAEREAGEKTDGTGD